MGTHDSSAYARVIFSFGSGISRELDVGFLKNAFSSGRSRDRPYGDKIKPRRGDHMIQYFRTFGTFSVDTDSERFPFGKLLQHRCTFTVYRSRVPIPVVPKLFWRPFLKYGFYRIRFPKSLHDLSVRPDAILRERGRGAYFGNR